MQRWTDAVNENEGCGCWCIRNGNPVNPLTVHVDLQYYYIYETTILRRRRHQSGRSLSKHLSGERDVKWLEPELFDGDPELRELRFVRTQQVVVGLRNRNTPLTA